MPERFSIRGFNLCESILRHSPEQLRHFIRRMKTLNMNTLITHYDYGWKRYGGLIMEECEKAGVGITLMAFGPRAFFRLVDWKKEWFAKNENGIPYFDSPVCETQICISNPEALEGFREGASKFLHSLPSGISRVHMRAGDGVYFCHCPKCADISIRDQWTIPLKIFLEEAQKVLPCPALETDIYYKRYEIPGDWEPYQDMTSLMYDTFGRNPLRPLASRAASSLDLNSAANLQDSKSPQRISPNLYHALHLQEWVERKTGGVYVHENVMMHRYCGIYQQNTPALLQDIRMYREMNIHGICFEAYEPGFRFFEKSFEVLARALNDPESIEDYVPTVLERKIATAANGMDYFCTDPEFPLSRQIADPKELKMIQLHRKAILELTAELAGKYLSFVFEHRDIFDPLWQGFNLLVRGWYSGKLKFHSLNEEEKRFLNSEKLWDFMEDIPLDEDPFIVTENLIFSIFIKNKQYK